MALPKRSDADGFEYMKVPVLFVVLLGVFAGSNALLRKWAVGRDHHGRLDCERKFALL